jgi:hypothetical protein
MMRRLSHAKAPPSTPLTAAVPSAFGRPSRQSARRMDKLSVRSKTPTDAPPPLRRIDSAGKPHPVWILGALVVCREFIPVPPDIMLIPNVACAGILGPSARMPRSKGWRQVEALRSRKLDHSAKGLAPIHCKIHHIRLCRLQLVFIHQFVTLKGMALSVNESTSRAGRKETSLLLTSHAGCGSGGVIVYFPGSVTISNGDRVQVEGTFETQHIREGSIFNNELQATKITPLPR